MTNRLLSDDNYSYSYDSNGNLIGKTPNTGVSLPTWGYVYNALDELIEVVKDGEVIERHYYDVFSRRTAILKTNGAGGFTRQGIISDGIDRVIDFGTSNRIEKRYTHSDRVDEPLLMEVFDTAGTRTDTLTYHTDHLGSVRYMTDESGDLANYYDYDSYGRPTVMVETIEQPFMYTAREWESVLGLYQYRAQ